MADPLLFSVRDLTEAGLGSRRSIYQALSDGTLKARKLGSKTVVPAEDLRRFISRLPVYKPGPVPHLARTAAQEAPR